MTIIVCNKITGYITLFIQDVNKEKVLWTKSDKNINTSSNVASSLDVCNIYIYTVHQAQNSDMQSPTEKKRESDVHSYKPRIQTSPSSRFRYAIHQQVQDSDIQFIKMLIGFRHTIHQQAQDLDTIHQGAQNSDLQSSKFRI